MSAAVESAEGSVGCPTCGQDGSGECPRCYAATGHGCPHGAVCAECAAADEEAK